MVNYVDIACRAVLAFTFGAAVWGKVGGRAQWDAFRSSLAFFLGTRGRAGHVMAVVVVMAETVAAALQVTPYRWGGYYVAFGLLTAFSGFVVVVLRRRLNLRCNCFGRSGLPLQGGHLVRNGLLLGITAAGLVAAITGGSSIHPAGLVMSLGVALCVALLIVRFDDIVRLIS
jgi:hypothetical protein